MQNPLKYIDPDGRLVWLVVPGVCAGGGCEALLVGGGLAWAASNINWPDGLDKPIDPWTDTNSGTEAQSCPTSSGEPPLDPRERCFNGVKLQYAACMQSGTNPLICQAKRAFGILACSARSSSGDD